MKQAKRANCIGPGKCCGQRTRPWGQPRGRDWETHRGGTLRGKPAGQGRGGTFRGCLEAWRAEPVRAKRALRGGVQPLTSQYPGPLGQPCDLQTLVPSSSPARPEALGSLQGAASLLRAGTPSCPRMSLPPPQEGLQHQIEKLVRENEELKKLVWLIRENYELKSAIKTQAGGLASAGSAVGLVRRAASFSTPG